MNCTRYRLLRNSKNGYCLLHSSEVDTAYTTFVTTWLARFVCPSVWEWLAVDMWSLLSSSQTFQKLDVIRGSRSYTIKSWILCCRYMWSRSKRAASLPEILILYDDKKTFYCKIIDNILLSLSTKTTSPSQPRCWREDASISRSQTVRIGTYRCGYWACACCGFVKVPQTTIRSRLC